MNLLFHSICVAVAIICATATAASTPRLWRDGSRRHLRPQQQRHRWTRVGTYKQKHSKKQNVVPPQCTTDQFVGDYKYRNCQGVETKVRIACDMDKGTKNPCDYQEAPLKNDNTDDGCVVQGSFGATHIMKDPANPAVCQLNFVALKDSCKANESPSGFGMRAEVDMTAGLADTSTSTLLLWFSNDGGDVYYNEDEPQDPVFLHQDIPTGRKLWGCNKKCKPNSEGSDYCKEGDCASEEWLDGCSACMCKFKDNDLWCDGHNYEYNDRFGSTTTEFYDEYFHRAKKNPWGDPNKLNRKCRRRTCDPLQIYLNEPNGCKTNDCAYKEWEDGCSACMCYNTGNDSWCDGSMNDYYDKYFDEHEENPWGDKDIKNRKCNKDFLETTEFPCEQSWQCSCKLGRCEGSESRCFSGWHCPSRGRNCVARYKENNPCGFKNPLIDDFWDPPTCDPRFPDNCEENDCADASDVDWNDGCAACMCFNQGNGSWCDGTRNDFYDDFYKEHGENPWGDKREENRKCNENHTANPVWKN